MHVDPISWKTLFGWTAGVLVVLGGLMVKGARWVVGKKLTEIEDKQSDHEDRIAELEKDNAVIHEALNNASDERRRIAEGVDRANEKMDDLKDTLIKMGKK